MLRNLGEFFAEKVSRWLPESLVFAWILTIITAVLVVSLTPTQAIALPTMWYQGFWLMLEFAMQMALIIVLGYTIGISAPVSRFFGWLALKIKKPTTAYVVISIVSLMLVLVNWGLAPVAAVFAANVCRRVKGIDFRLACASVYVALIPWHGGLSASAPLMMNTPDNQFIEMGLVDSVIPTSATLGSTLNIVLIITSVILIPIIIRLMVPKKADERFDAALQWEQTGRDPEEAATQVQAELEKKSSLSPSDLLNNSKILNYIIVIAGFAFLIPYFANKGIDGLELNTANFFFLMLGLALHASPAKYIAALKEAVKAIGDLVVQFPFYAGIMGLFMFSGLSEVVTQWFISISTEVTFPFFAFITAGIVNLFIPSGGGEWTVMAPILIPAAQEMGVPLGKLIIAFGYGDGLTNLINPFWTLAFLPVMAKIMDIRPRDFMGYAVLVCLIFFVIISAAIFIVP